VDALSFELPEVGEVVGRHRARGGIEDARTLGHHVSADNRGFLWEYGVFRFAATATICAPVLQHGTRGCIIRMSALVCPSAL
jgi:hypothetical protein